MDGDEDIGDWVMSEPVEDHWMLYLRVKKKLYDLGYKYDDDETLFSHPTHEPVYNNEQLSYRHCLERIDKELDKLL